jgi:hypothetical protein
MSPSLEDLFPGLRTAPHKITSEATPSYNCVAWAAGQTDAWWWPDPMYISFWPAGIPRVESMDMFVRVFEGRGYFLRETADVEYGFEKIAIYMDQEGRPTHIARQLPSGLWTSKLGKLEDIEHAAPGDLNGSRYGSAAVFLKRKTQHKR